MNSVGVTEITVTVTGEVNTPIIGLFSNVSATASGPKERFYEEQERR